ncbi:hypothetical protein LIER_22916 [Lithospermum erythrorhizon]|uniref:Retrotransposon gag domain-containing protein n=1 Tax=Lithospermum erythrorhizon TaxID=34254 RepID=A0AAV3QVR5_LITER
MEPNGSNNNRPVGNDGLNQYNSADLPPESVPANAQGPVNLETRGTMPEVGCSHPPEVAGLIQGLTGTIVTSVMQHLREQIPQLRDKTPWNCHLSGRIGKRLILRMAHEHVVGQQSRHDALALEAVAPTPSTYAMVVLQCLAPLSPEIRSAIMQAGMKLTAFTKFTGKTDPEEHVAEFQSQMPFYQPDNRVYYMAFPSSLAGQALKWFNQLLGGCITSFEELKKRFT